MTKIPIWITLECDQAAARQVAQAYVRHLLATGAEADLPAPEDIVVGDPENAEEDNR